jgi:hypothetical protein
MVNTAIVGPLSHQSPTIVSNLNNGTIMGTPVQVDSSERNSISRQMLFRTIQTRNQLDQQRKLVLEQPKVKHMNYIKPMDSSMRISMLKGQSYASNTIVNSTKNYSPSTTSTVSGSKNEPASTEPSEKKKFFGKKKSEKVKESSKEQTQAPQVDPDDPWA